MTRDEYNAKVQEVMLWPIPHRVRPEYFRSVTNINELPKLWRAVFEVYYGDWIALGWQYNPFQPNVEYEWNETLAIKTLVGIGRDLCK